MNFGRKISGARKGGFYTAIEEAENRGASPEELLAIIGTGKTKVGIYDGDVENGELEIGQAASQLCGTQPQSVAQVFDRLISEYREAKAKVAL